MILTKKEWLTKERGTTATKVKTYNDSGNLVAIEYVLTDNDHDHDLEQAQAVSSEYITDSVSCIRI